MKQAHEIFLSGEFPEISAACIDAAAAGIPDVDDGRVFVSLDDTDFLEFASHYLIYGSEFICAIAAGLSRTSARDYRQVLKRWGTPTIFRLKLPLGAISESDRNQFVEALSQQVPHVRRRRPVPAIDFTFRLRSGLPADSVLGHRHPERVLDPFLGMRPYCFAEERTI